MRLLLYGGTFDPPHNGHLNNLRAAAARVRPDRVVAGRWRRRRGNMDSSTGPSMRRLRW